MGVGSFLSRYVQRGAGRAASWRSRCSVGLVGGWAATLLFLAFAQTPHFRVVLYGLVGADRHAGRARDPTAPAHPARAGSSSGSWWPRCSRSTTSGALAASLLFPLLLVPRARARPHLARWSAWPTPPSGSGPPGSSGAIWPARGLRCARSASSSCWPWAAGRGDGRAPHRRGRRIASTPTTIILAQHTRRTSASCSRAGSDDLRLFLNGHLQFSSRDEYRYHEALVHPALAAHPRAPPRAGARRRRRPGGARDPALPGRASRSRWSTSTPR